MKNYLKFVRIMAFLTIPLKYRDEKFYWTYQKDVKWPDDYRDLQTLGSLEYQKV